MACLRQHVSLRTHSLGHTWLLQREQYNQFVTHTVVLHECVLWGHDPGGITRLVITCGRCEASGRLLIVKSRPDLQRHTFIVVGFMCKAQCQRHFRLGARICHVTWLVVQALLASAGLAMASASELHVVWPTQATTSMAIHNMRQAKEPRQCRSQLTTTYSSQVCRCRFTGGLDTDTCVKGNPLSGIRVCG